MYNIVYSIITSTFDTQFQRRQRDLEVQEAMLITFKLKVDFETEKGHRFLDILIYAPTNYVGVFTRNRWGVQTLKEDDPCEDDPRYENYDWKWNEGSSNWVCESYHDSCWGDAIRSILVNHMKIIVAIDTFPGWYETRKLKLEEITEFLHLTRK